MDDTISTAEESHEQLITLKPLFIYADLCYNAINFLMLVIHECLPNGLLFYSFWLPASVLWEIFSSSPFQTVQFSLQPNAISNEDIVYRVE